MKKTIFSFTILSALAFSIGAAISFNMEEKEYAVTEAYSTSSLPTTINLNDNTEQEIRNYYSGLTTLSDEEKSGDNLLKNLKTILKKGQKYYSYDTDSSGRKIWQMYEITDRDWNKSPASSTTYGTYNESTNIISSYQYGTSNSNGKNNPYLHALYINRSVENQVKAWGNHNQDEWGINREHLWPKSQGFQAEGEGGARGDPMHLISGNGYSNNIHNDHHYGYVDKAKSYTDCGNTYSNQRGNLLGTSKTIGTGTVFEPQDCDKGDIARAIFYMVARYNYLSGSDSDGINQNNPNLELVNYSAEKSAYTSSTTETGKMGIVQDLLEWNRIDPPDEYEIHRNNLLYQNFTNNRNPFIDFPEWAEYIWGKSYNGEYDKTVTGVANPTTDLINKFASSETLIKLQSIAVTTNPTKTTYEIDDTFDSAGLKVTATYSDSSSKEVTGYTLSTPDMSTAGTKTITVTYQGKTTTFTITVTEPVISLSSISLSGSYKTSFIKGEEFSFGGTVTANYSDSTTKNVTQSASFTGYDMSKTGNQTVTVSYTEEEVTKTTTYTIAVINPEVSLIDISVDSNPDKVTYFVGESFISAGLVIKAKYSDESELTISDYTLSEPDMSTAGEKTITVTYQDKTTTFKITVNSIELSSISLSGDYKTTFNKDETFSFGGVVTATYSNGATKDVTSSASFTGYNMSQTGNQTVTVSYTEGEITKTTSYQITINNNAPTLTKIAVTSSPTKIVYEVGEELDKTGLVVTATYSDGSEKAITDYTLSGYDKNKVGTQIITVTYQNMYTTFVIVVNEAKPQVDELKEEKDKAVNDLLTYYKSFDLSKYTQENRERLFNIYNNTEQAINEAKTLEEINSLLSSAKTAMDVVPKIENKPASNGCGGNIMATSIIISSVALICACLLIYKKKRTK